MLLAHPHAALLSLQGQCEAPQCDLKPLPRRRKPLHTFGPYVCHGEGNGITADTLATKRTKSKRAAATSRSHGHAATSTSDRWPHLMAEHGLERTQSLHGTYSMDRIVAICYNV